MKAGSQIPEIATSNAVKALADAVASASEEDVNKIIFFGSRMKGRFTPDSDIDILMIVNNKTQELTERIFSIADRIERDILGYSIALTIHIMSRIEYEKYKSSGSIFIEAIEREGEIIYERTA
jgi:predicted nucleotidyltransferase